MFHFAERACRRGANALAGAIARVSIRENAPQSLHCGGAARHIRRQIQAAHLVGNRPHHGRLFLPASRANSASASTLLSASTGVSAAISRPPKDAAQRACLIGYICTRQHARYFFQPRIIKQWQDIGADRAVFAALADLPMMVTARRHLRAVRDHQNLPFCASRCSLVPTASATAPPTPASTSSNISVPPCPSAASDTFKASMKRASSPPEAILAIGPGAMPDWSRRRNLFYQCRAPPRLPKRRAQSG